jgi:hypothetical protein
MMGRRSRGLLRRRLSVFPRQPASLVSTDFRFDIAGKPAVMGLLAMGAGFLYFKFDILLYENSPRIFGAVAVFWINEPDTRFDCTAWP